MNATAKMDGKGIESIYINGKGEIVVIWSFIQNGNIRGRAIWSQTFSMV